MKDIINVPISDMYVVNKKSRPYLKNDPKWIAVHWTASEGHGANAVANAKYFQRAERAASAHYVVDDQQILRCIPGDEIAYSVGAKKYTEWALKNIGKAPNKSVISIEMCVNSDGDFWKMYSNTARLVATLMYHMKCDINHVIRHYDVTGKNCPAFFVSNDKAMQYIGKDAATAWQEFKANVERLHKEVISE